MKGITQMKINKLVVRGPLYQRTLDFSTGMNIIRGEKTSGKSLVLSLIDYCLGKTKIPLKVQLELSQHVDTVFLEINFGEEVYTISRGLKKEISNFYVYYSLYSDISEFMPEKMTKKELQTFLMDKIGITEFKRKKSKKKSQELTMETISFRDILRYCYVHQHDLGTHNFLANNDNNVRYKNPIAFEMIFDLVDDSQNDVQSKIVEEQNLITQLIKRRDGLIEYLEQRGNEKFVDLIDKIDEFEDQIEQHNTRKMELLNKQTDATKSITANSDFVLIKNEIRKIDDKADMLRRDINRNNRGIESNTLLLKDYLREKENIRVTEDINYKLKISDHKLTCPLCHSEIENMYHEEESKPSSEKVFKALLSDLENKISMVNRVIGTSEQAIETKKQELKYLERKKNILSMAAEEFSKDIKTPFLPELNSINITINNLEKDKEILLESQRVHKKVDEIDKNIEAAKIRLDSLNSKLKDFENRKNRKDSVLNELNKTYVRNMRNMKYSDLSGTYIDSKTYIPYYRDASVYEHQSGGLLECMQFSYLDAIISSNQAKNHPKFLMLDSVSKYFGTLQIDNEEVSEDDLINDPEVYRNIFKLLVDLSEVSQIVVVENTPPEEMEEYVKYTFRNGARGFIDLDKNEFDMKESEEE
ncbi:hypothetical protein PMX19_20000 [Enterococcus avium]|nr:hypothetical protein [Enterococcus avium]MDB1734361.1 hypothetical protein [Enterococcus avium]